MVIAAKSMAGTVVRVDALTPLVQSVSTRYKKTGMWYSPRFSEKVSHHDVIGNRISSSDIVEDADVTIVCVGIRGCTEVGTLRS